jgi:hypothetical protein
MSSKAGSSDAPCPGGGGAGMRSGRAPRAAYQRCAVRRCPGSGCGRGSRGRARKPGARVMSQAQNAGRFLRRAAAHRCRWQAGVVTRQPTTARSSTGSASGVNHQAPSLHAQGSVPREAGSRVGGSVAPECGAETAVEPMGPAGGSHRANARSVAVPAPYLCLRRRSARRIVSGERAAAWCVRARTYFD